MECSEDGCSRKAKAKGLCSGHYERLRITGVTGGPLNSRRSSLADVAAALGRAVRSGDAPPNGLTIACLIYPGKGVRGRPYMRDAENRGRPAPSVAYEFLVGPIPAGHGVLHHCDIPACIEPTHLYTGDQRQNMADKIERGRDRSPRGEASGVSRLTDDKVREIRSRRAAGETTASIARGLGVAHNTVSAVVSGRTWAHVT